MKFNIDNAIAQMWQEPWDLTLTIGGVDCLTRQLHVGDLDRLKSLSNADRATQITALAGLFVTPPGNFENWSDATMAFILAHVIGYQQARLSKNSRAAAAMVAAAVMSETTPANR